MNDGLPTYYEHLKIKPWDYAEANGLTFTEGCILKYLSRYRHNEAGGIQDLLKARHCIDALIERLRKPDLATHPLVEVVQPEHPPRGKPKKGEQEIRRGKASATGLEGAL